MNRLTREGILAAPDIVEKDVDVPIWGGSVKIRTISKAEQIAMRRQAITEVDGNGKPMLDEEKLEILVFIHGVVEPKFTVADYEALKAKSATAMDVVLAEIYRGSGMTKEVAREAETSFPAGSS